MLDTIKQLEKAGQRLLEFKDVLAISISKFGTFEVQVRTIDTVEALAGDNGSEFVIKRREYKELPWEVETKVGLVRVFALLTHSELENYAKENLINMDSFITKEENCPSGVGASAEAVVEALSIDVN